MSTPPDSHLESLTRVKSHKRALSAPNFPASIHGYIPEIKILKSQPIETQAEPTPLSSQHSDRTSPRTMSTFSTPDTPPPPKASGEIVPAQTILCMYIPNCDTGSQLRKAISHIFGRNKMCTRLIPAEVWVHYCRKHYQRSRYRNPKEYAKLQCDLVQQQIRRVHEWSVENASRGLPGVVKDWGLAIRKREQKRLDELTGAKKRNAHAAFDDGLRSDDEDGSGRSHILPATAVPDWLLQECGENYTTHKIIEIFNRLHAEILADTMVCFPDIEILPNIAVDGDEPKSPKGYSKRVQTTKGHSRSQSLGVAAVTTKSSIHSQDRRMSQPAIWTEGDYATQAAKKRRSNGMSDAKSPDSSFFPYTRGHPIERQLQAGRVTQLPHRPVFPDINETAEEERYNHGSRSSHSGASLIAPTPQRTGGQSMAAHLEMGNSHSARRLAHRRTRSDMSTFTQGNRGPSGLPMIPSSYMEITKHDRDHFQGFTAHRSSVRGDSRFHEMQAPQRFPNGPALHGRHQSMSTLPSAATYSQISSAYHPQVTQCPPRKSIFEPSRVQNMHSDRR